jgi:hypothetical protein
MTKITKEEFEAYEKVRRSGVTNMYAVNVVSSYSGLSKNKIIDIMKNYDALMKQYPNVRRQ